MSDGTELVVAGLSDDIAITANFSEVAAELERRLELYRDAVITRDYYKQAKKDRAYLNGLSRSLHQRRREVKAACLRPYEAFQAEVDRLDGIIRDAADPIDEQIKAIEAELRDEKREALRTHWSDYAGIAAELVPYERIEDPKWLNLSVSPQVGIEAIEAIVNKLAADEAALTELDLPYAEDAKAVLFETLDLSAAIAKNGELTERAEQLARFEREKAEIIAQSSAALEAATEPEEASDAPQAPEVPQTEEKRPQEPERVLWTFTVEATLDERDSIILALSAIGVKGRVRRA